MLWHILRSQPDPRRLMPINKSHREGALPVMQYEEFLPWNSISTQMDERIYVNGRRSEDVTVRVCPVLCKLSPRNL